MIRLKGLRHLDEYVELRAFVTWLERELEIEEPIVIEYDPEIYALYLAPDRPVDEDKEHTILIVRRDGLLDTVAHELSHHLQWRDPQRKMSERGIRARARTYVRRWTEERAK